MVVTAEPLEPTLVETVAPVVNAKVMRLLPLTLSDTFTVVGFLILTVEVAPPLRWQNTFRPLELLDKDTTFPVKSLLLTASIEREPVSPDTDEATKNITGKVQPIKYHQQ